MVKLLKPLEIIVFGSVLALLFSSSVPTADGLMVAGSTPIAEVEPGDRVEFALTVSINEDEPPTNITAKIFGLGQDLDGEASILDSEDDTSPYSIRELLRLSPSTFHLEPGQSQKVVLTGRIPINVGSGTRYAAMDIATEPYGNGSVAVSLSINVPVALTISGTGLARTGNITSIGLVNTTEGLIGLVTFENTGNHHYRAQAWSILSNETGHEVANFTTSVTFTSIIPNNSALFLLPFAPDEHSPGIYLLNVYVSMDDGTLLDEDTRSFSIRPDGNVTGTVGLEELKFESQENVTEDKAEIVPPGNMTGTDSSAVIKNLTNAIGKMAVIVVGKENVNMIRNEIVAIEASATLIANASGEDPGKAEVGLSITGLPLFPDLERNDFFFLKLCSLSMEN